MTVVAISCAYGNQLWSPITQADVFFDLGSGLGQVPILVNLLSGAAAKGMEFEPVYCVLGGIIGVVLGVVGAQVITPLLGSNQAIVTSQSVVLALAVSLAIGVFFGLYPANRAASLNAIDALRYE
jgi:hypothetical protein